MKDSGVEWIGKIPDEWKISKYKNFAQSGMGLTLLKQDLLDFPTETSIPVFSATQSDRIFGYTENKSLLLNSGDLIIPARGNSIGYIKYVKELATTTQTTIYSKIISDKINSMFLKYCGDGLREYWFEFDNTAIPQITVNQVNNNYVPVPSIQEQRKIVDKLNPISSNINRVINETKQSIEELKKYKLSIITETVTKGLDSKVELKESGIPWIGKIPEVWNVIKLNRLFSIKKEIANQTGYDILSVTQRGLKVKDISQNEGQMAADYSKYQIVQPDDFVMNHMDLLTGWVDLAVQEGVTSPDYRVFYNKQKKIVFDRYYLYIFQICYLNKIFYGLGQGVSNIGRWRLQTDKFLNFYLPLPPVEEQKEIVNYLDNQIKKVDILIEDKIKAIEELEKYKKSIIYEYVTGKKEV